MSDKSEAALQKPKLRVRCPVLREVVYPTTSPDLQEIRYLHPGLLGVLPMVQVIFLWAMAICGSLTPAVLTRSVRIFLVASTLRILLPSAAPLAQSRFRIPAVPALSVLAAARAVQLRVRSVHRKRIAGIRA